jgi:hypothetical protein
LRLISRRHWSRDLADEFDSKQIVGFSSELQDSAAQLEKLEVNLEDLRAKKAEAIAAIQVARSKCDQYTKSDVFRLQGASRSPVGVPYA